MTKPKKSIWRESQIDDMMKRVFGLRRMANSFPGVETIGRIRCSGSVENLALASRLLSSLDHTLIIAAGKSVICSYILQLLEQFSGKYHVCYYFCNSTEAGNICGQILRTVALQLLRRNVDLASLVANQYVYPGSSCSLAQLRNLLPQMLEVTRSTRIVIDGLDECSEESQISVLKDLLRLIGKDVSCKVIFASRREVKIAEKLSNKPQIKLDNREEVESDIRLYVKYQVGSIETDDSDLRQKIESILVEKANGE